MDTHGEEWSVVSWGMRDHGVSIIDGQNVCLCAWGGIFEEMQLLLHHRLSLDVRRNLPPCEPPVMMIKLSEARNMRGHCHPYRCLDI
jgi:hypothetical protein